MAIRCGRRENRQNVVYTAPVDVSAQYRDFISRVCRPAREGRTALLERMNAAKDPLTVFRHPWTPRIFRSVSQVGQRIGEKWLEQAPDARPGVRRHSHLSPNLDGGPAMVSFYDIEERPLPADLDTLATFAADLDGVTRAESLAIEVARALVPWGGSEPKRLVWSPCRFGGDGSPTHADQVLSQVDYFTSEALGDADVTVSRPKIPEPALGRASTVWTMAVNWLRACETKLLVPAQTEDPYFAFGPAGPPRAPAAVVGQPFSSLDDPTQPLVEVWRLGYVFEGVENGDVLLQFPVT